MSNENSFIKLVNINKIYPNHVQAVYDFNLDINKYEFIALVGPSGCGKSTTLRMIAGLEEITSGELYIDNKLANDLSPKDRDLAFVFQSYALYPQMSVYNNLAFGLKMRKIKEEKKDKEGKPILSTDKRKIVSIKKDLKHIEHDIILLNKFINNNDKNKETYILRVNELKDEKDKLLKQLDYYLSTPQTTYIYRHYTKEEIDEKVLKAAKTLEIEKYLRSKPSELSGGQRQRVALGRAIVRDTHLFLMDEPLSNLDAKLRVAMRSEIVELHKKIKSTTIYVTHDQTEAMTMADRIVVMKDGYIQQVGTPKEIYDHPANLFVASFIGSPAMNMINATLKDGVLTLNDEYELHLNEEQLSLVYKFFNDELINLNKKKDDLIELINKKTTYLKNNKLRNKIKKSLNKEIDKLNEDLNLTNEHISIFKDRINTNSGSLIIGIRPENIKLYKDVVHFNKYSSPLPIKVKIPELLGNEYYIHTYLFGTNFICKIDTKELIKMDDVLEIVFDKNSLNIFDPITNEGIF